MKKAILAVVAVMILGGLGIHMFQTAEAKSGATVDLYMRVFRCETMGNPLLTDAKVQAVHTRDRDILATVDGYVDENGEIKQSIIFSDAYTGYPNWSKDGSKITYLSDETGFYELWIMNPDGSQQVQITIFGDDDVGPPDRF